MAKKKSQDNNSEKNVSDEIRNMKKKMTLVIILMLLVLIITGVGVFFLTSSNKSNGDESQTASIETTQIKDLKSETEHITYTRDIAKQTYMIPNGAILFEATMIFYNKECANLYNDITDLKAQQSTTPEFTDKSTLGDKITKSAITLVLQSESKDKLKSTSYLSETIKKAVNDAFIDKYGQEIIKEVLITNHVVQ